MSDITFEEALQRLEQLVDQLEAGKLGLEESLKVFEEGVALRGAAHAILTTPRNGSRS
jgi:exodeoxyribonuclease VII small subunit